MKRGVGIDLIEIDRIKKSVLNPNFLTRWFGGDEILEYNARGGKINYIAANFCAKEAFSKAIGTGIRGFGLKEVQLLRDGLGKPYLKLSGDAEKIAERLGLEFEASISHTKHYAVAIVEAYSVIGGNDG